MRKFKAPLTAVKFVEGRDDVIEGLILPYGGPANGRDLTGTFFTKDTDFCLEWFPDGGRPGLYRHGFDAALKANVIGREIGGRDDEHGHWLQAQLDKSNEYWADVKELIDAGRLFMSSGSVDHLVDVAVKSGEIRRWPWVEWSLVPNPANPDQPAVREAPGTKGWDEAAWDAARGANILASLLDLISEESDEPDQVAMLQSAADSLSEWLTAERGEIGTPEGDEMGAFLSLDRAVARMVASVKEGKRNSTTDESTLRGAHDAIASVIGLDCAAGAGKSTEVPPAPVLAVKAGDSAEPTPADVAAFTAAVKEAVAAEMRRQLG